MRQLFFITILLLSISAIAQEETHKAVANVPAVRSTGAGHTSDATPAEKHSTRTSQHPSKSPAGTEASRQKAQPVRAAHSGPTSVRTPTGAEAAHARPARIQARHTGPTPVKTSNEKRERSNTTR